MEDLLQCVLGCGLCSALREPTGCMFSVSWIRHLGMACGEMFVVHCSHSLPATAELPFANRPGDRTDRFRSTCHSSLLVVLNIYCVLVLCRYHLGGFSFRQMRIF